MNIIQFDQDFDSSDYMMYEKNEIYGLHIWRRKVTDSGGIFKIEKKSPKKNTLADIIQIEKECKVFWIYTSGCIRVSQQELDWLVENIELGTTMIM